MIVLVYDNGSDVLLYGSIGLIGLASLLTLFVVIKTVIAKPDFINLESTIMSELG